jgi:hypothetical protein
MVGGCWNAVKFGSFYPFDQFSGEHFPVRPCLLRIIYVRMTLEEFRKSLNSERPPEGLTLSLAALWWDARGDWTKAHESAQQDEGPAGAWVHAYLHRKEGDLSNAGYWYGRAGKPQGSVSLDQEWVEIVTALVSERR